MFRPDQVVDADPRDRPDALRILILGEHRALREALGSALRTQGFDATCLALPVEGAPVDEVRQQLLSTMPEIGLMIARLDDAEHVVGAVGLVRDIGLPWVVLSLSPPGPGWGAVLGAGARDVCSTSEDLPGLAELLRHRISSANHARADRLRSAATEAWDRASQRHRSMTLRLETLSTREMSILSALDRGNAVPKIAARWGVSDKAMHSEVATILDKLGVDSPDEACTTLRELDDWFHA